MSGHLRKTRGYENEGHAQTRKVSHLGDPKQVLLRARFVELGDPASVVCYLHQHHPPRQVVIDSSNQATY
jgi:hypothetical protein